MVKVFGYCDDFGLDESGLMRMVWGQVLAVMLVLLTNFVLANACHKSPQRLSVVAVVFSIRKMKPFPATTESLPV